MTAQPSLFEQPHTGRARQGDPETSKRAARRINPNANRYRIVQCLLIYGPQNDRQICERVAPDEPLRWQSIISARSGLKKDGIVEAIDDSGDRIIWALVTRYRPTETVVPSAAVL